MNTSTLRHRLALSPQHGFLLGLLLLLIGLSYQYSFKAVSHRSAILRWQEQLLGLIEGDDIYQRYVYPNPPIMALILYPLATLPPLAGALTWFYLKAALTLLVFVWLFRLIEQPDRPFPAWAKALTVLLSLRPIMGDLSHGNVNLFILFVVVAALYALHRGRDGTAGVLLALAIACKVTPALFVPYFLWKRAWKTLAGCAVGLGLFFWVVPACFLGWEENARHLETWYLQMVKPYVLQGVVTSEHNNQSLPGLVHRLVTHSPSFSTYVDNQYTPVDYHNWVSLDPRGVRWLLKGCMLLFAGLVVWSCRTSLSERRGLSPPSATAGMNPAVNGRLAAEFSLVVLGMLLFSERTWKHHCVTLVLPFAVLAYYLAACRPAPLLRGYVIGTLVMVTLLMATTSTSLLDRWPGSAKLAQVYGAYVWAYLLLVVALVVLLRTKEEPASANGALGSAGGSAEACPAASA